MIYLKSQQEINLLRQSATLVSLTLAEVAKYVEPGVATKKLDQVAEDFIKKNNAIPSFKGYGPKHNSFPGTLCISVNEQVVHGFPSNYKLQEGDIVSVDCGVYKNGFHGDQAYTFVVGQADESTMALLRTTMEALYKGIQEAVHGNKVGDIGHAIQSHCEGRGYGVVRELVGHGLGRTLHEEPSVPNFGKQGKGARLRSGMTLAIEPMITMGSWKVKTLGDGWTVVTTDGKKSAHYEHDIAITENGSEILTNFQYIEELTKISIYTPENIHG